MQSSRETFNAWVHRFGIVSCILLFIGMTAFPVAISAVYGIWPKFSLLWPALVAAVLFMAPWWPGETIGYMPVMGPGALYMSYITGNTTNLRMPATVGTINALGIEPNTDECHTVAIIACGASVVTSVTVMAMGLLIAVPLKPVLEAPVLQPAFNFVIPALFGGLVAQTVLKAKSTFALFLIPLAACLLFRYCTKINSAYYMLAVIALSGVVFVMNYKRGK